MLYTYAQKWRGLYAKYIESGKLYPSVSMYDDLAYAAVWIYMATGAGRCTVSLTAGGYHEPAWQRLGMGSLCEVLLCLWSQRSPATLSAVILGMMTGKSRAGADLKLAPDGQEHSRRLANHAVLSLTVSPAFHKV